MTDKNYADKNFAYCSVFQSDTILKSLGNFFEYPLAGRNWVLCPSFIELNMFNMIQKVQKEKGNC